MGKKSDGPSIHSRMNLGGYDRELERYGVKGPQFGRSDAGQEYRSARDVEKELIDAARNDPDTRRTLEAAAMSGKGKAQKILDSGFKSIDDVTNASNFMEKAAKRHGQGGDFSSASDYMGLTQSMVERDREKQTQAYEKQFASTDDLNALKKKMMAAAAGKKDENSPATPSDRLAQAQDRMATAANDPSSLYSKNNADAPKADDQADAARNFLADYKSDVIEGAGLEQDIEGNLSRASKAVTDIYGR